jgi:pimeloyl-ACP methyl ester carboxylesterase
VTLFVHGFLGSTDDWDPVLDRVSGRAVPIPRAASLEEAADALVPAKPCLIVGYSLGGRLAMLAAARNPGAFTGVVAISADPGHAGDNRAALDAGRANRLEQGGLSAFLEAWYEAELWTPLRAHPSFPAMLRRRNRGAIDDALWALRKYSAGLQPDLWECLPQDLTVVVGGEDPKYLAIGQRMGARGIPLHILPAVGHAIPVEAPEALATIVRDCCERTSLASTAEVRRQV